MFPSEKKPSQKRVMIVDDEKESLEMMQTMLGDQGYELIPVSNATEVGLKAAQLMPDLILLDFLMPEINGFEVCRALRGNELTRSIPIMAVTCLSKEEDIERIFECGADEYLPKPFKVDQLLEKVGDLIGKGRTVE
jgi:CheY-like chemotaxis protein